MESNQNNTEDLQEIVNRNEKVFSHEKRNYLYPNGHRSTHQMKWYKASRYNCLRSDIAA